ncbi:DUF4932 domain-containing protein [Neolewinella sp.]|uniref:DUF4932 domain-containing protein n=1 Tax=Neolewinella sp. TaxID=2993543 RepID=UPI003B51985B
MLTYFPYIGKIDTFKVVSAVDSLTTTFSPGSRQAILFLTAGGDTVTNYLIGRPSPVAYSEEYKRANRGQFRAEIPPVEELYLIAFALTKLGEADDNLSAKDSDYYTEVMNHFGQFRDHQLIVTLNAVNDSLGIDGAYGHYNNMRMNSCMYRLTEDGKIANPGPYRVLSFESDNDQEPLLEDFADFARTSQFAAFYENHLPLYNLLETQYQQEVDVHGMWDWLENRFPARYDSYVIYFSPLIGGYHATQRFTQDDFSETVMFVNAPSDDVAATARVVFTEIDHNYVNPVSDTVTAVSTALLPLAYWNTGAQGYPNSYQTFNEYLTWAVFSLYLRDTFSEAVFTERNTREAGFMVDERGFPQFGAFNDFVLDWYATHPDRPLPELWPAALDWMAGVNCGE